MPLSLTATRLACVLLTASALAACGGGGGGKSAATGSQGAPPAGSSNSAPTITGQPGTAVLIGTAYSFQPAAKDADGDTLTFTATNLPSWVTLNASSGRLSGTPASSAVGTYAGITIVVSDGKSSATLGPFSIAVTATASGSVSLSWVPPTQNSDGTTLLDLTGYRVLYGRSADDLDQTVSLTNPSLSTYLLDNLTSGTWYFAVVAVNTAGVPSSLSNVASKTIS